MEAEKGRALGRWRGRATQQQRQKEESQRPLLPRRPPRQHPGMWDSGEKGLPRVQLPAPSVELVLCVHRHLHSSVSCSHSVPRALQMKGPRPTPGGGGGAGTVQGIS